MTAVADDTPMLRGFWYIAASARRLSRRRLVPMTMLGDSIVLGLKADGSPFAYADSCPHRGMPMRHGTYDGDCLRCCYHGWAFSAANGACTEIPAIADPESITPGRFRLRAYPCRAVQGNVWVFIPEGRTVPDPLPEIPLVPGFDGAAPQITATMRFKSNADIAAMGFCDPAHPAFVHTSRWWKSKSGLQLRLKEKQFEPAPLGFRMKQHSLAHGANPYRLLGRDVRIDIGLQLPGIRIEHIRGSRHAACVLATVTPITPDATDVHYCVYWTVPWLGALKPLARWMARDFLRQDLEIAEKLTENAIKPPMMFVGDPDEQVRWQLRLKRAWLASRRTGQPFENPIRAQTLQWRS